MLAYELADIGDKNWRSYKQEYDYKGSGENEKLPPRRFSTVGIVRKVP
jgi:hypothetical protein